ncbi:MAG TPA: serine/threonine-protein kinase [Nannocystaceae bacterium]|nr:serine/threonine-protein kinase [Nannocystaceae bacterium]
MIEREPEVGPEIGRYLVIEEIGSGGMGRVFRAYDPKLGREVALKRLRLRTGDDRSIGARMLREAKTMAALAHPNVVPVYDVDIDHGSLYIAMEYVRGATLKTWVVRGQHDWRTVLAMFVQAGRGLAAAHAQGIVHRDFKPGNVVVGEDGRARVMDFGLARAVGGASDDPLPDALADPELAAFDSGGASSDLGATLTELGTVVGTPAYMAPEQHLGQPVDARGDQYAFCVALWEALYHRPAFKGRTLAELAAAKHAPPPRPSGSSGVPAALHPIVSRGLLSDPNDRWPDMPTLLAALERMIARKSRRLWIALGVGAAAIAAIAWSRRDSPCSAGDAELAEVWNDDVRADVESGLLASNASYATSTSARVIAVIDEDARAWAEMHHDSCAATRIRREQSDEALDLRMGCLRSHRRELGAAIELLVAADTSVAENAIDLVAALPPLSRCADVAALRERVPPPEQAEVRASVDDVRVRLGQARMQARAGHLDDALATARDARADAHATGYAPLDVEAQVELGALLVTLDRVDEAQPLLERGFEDALAHRDLHTAATAAIQLVDLLARKGIREDKTEWLARMALGLAEGDGSDVHLIGGALLAYGNMYLEGELEHKAEPYFVAAIERLETEYGPEHPDLVVPLLYHGEVLAMLKRRDEADALMQRALAIAETAYGPDHPQVAVALKLTGFEALDQGRNAEAKAAFDRAYEINEAAFGPDHPAVFGALGMRMAPLSREGKYAEAIAIGEEALRRVERNLPELHYSRAATMQNLSNVYHASGDKARAAELMREVVRVRRANDHKGTLASALSTLGEVLEETGEYEEAERSLVEATQVSAEAHADDGVYYAGADYDLAAFLYRRGQLARAKELLERSLARIEKEQTPGEFVQVRFLLGRVLWDLDDDRRRAVLLVERANEAAARRGSDDDAELVAETREWLDTHVLPPREDPLAR